MPYPDMTNPSPIRHSMPDIGWLASRCLQASPHPLSCDNCLSACPAEALTFVEDDTAPRDGLRLVASDACHGCAQCVAACPTEALLSSEIEHLAREVNQHPPGTGIVLACHRVSDESTNHTLHCLRALGPDMLGWLESRTADSEVELVIPESCASCVASPTHPDDDWLAAARTHCRVTTHEARQPYRSAAAPFSRRGFLLGQPGKRLPTVTEGDTRPDARRLKRQIAAADTLGEPRSPTLPALSLDTATCQAHGVCARICPTSALQETDAGELVFDPLACIDCGHCLSACPEQALQPGHSDRETAWTLRQGHVVECFGCRRPFVLKTSTYRQDNAQQCPACRREAALMEESFHELFG